MPQPAPEVVDRIQELMDLYPSLADRFIRHLLTKLHNKGLASIDSIYDEARSMMGEQPIYREAEDDPNSPSAVRWEGNERQAVRVVTLRQAAAHLSLAEIEEGLNLLRRREAAEQLENLATLPDVPVRMLSEHVKRFCQLPMGGEQLAPNEILATRVALIRNFISDQLEFIGVAKNFLRIRDLDWILDRIIGLERGQGRIGGKASGMLLGTRILQGARMEHRDSRAADVHLPESWFVRSDVIAQFLRLNGLEEYQSQKYKDAESIRSEFPIIRQLFRNAEFPSEIVQQLDKLLEQIGEVPLIVRSSSLLEDRFGTAFSGMYASVFLGNQGPRRDRLEALLGAIAEVYASTLGPDPILYRRRHNLIDYNEDMAILIQKVVGRAHGRFFLPDAAGVAYSRNEYRWSPRIKAEDGIARVVLGLGTRAVDRTGNDYPRMMALGAPLLKPAGSVQEVYRRSQRSVDVVDLEENKFRTVAFRDLFSAGSDVPGLDIAASVWTGDALVQPAGAVVGEDPSELCLTFDRLASRTTFAGDLRDRLRRIEDAYNTTINLEFAYLDGKFYLLQCRPLVQAISAEGCQVPLDIPQERKLFASRGLVRSGELMGIDYLVVVDPWAYDRIDSLDTRLSLGRAVGRINDALENKTFVLLGPGRWGSNDSRLGVKVTYADISHAKALVEIAVRKGSFVPEVSYGTHFFQELVEEGIFYLALYPDEPEAAFNFDFFKDAPNALADVSPKDAEFAELLKVIDVARALPGRKVNLVMEGDAAQALCWIG